MTYIVCWSIIFTKTDPLFFFLAFKNPGQMFSIYSFHSEKNKLDFSKFFKSLFYSFQRAQARGQDLVGVPRSPLIIITARRSGRR